MKQKIAKAGQYLGHRYTTVMAITFAYSVTASIIVRNMSNAVQWIGFGPLVAVCTVMILSANQHKTNLCSYCFDEFPLDTGSAVKKNIRKLKQYHWIDDNSKLFEFWMFALMAAIFGFSFAKGNAGYFGTQSLFIVIAVTLYISQRTEKMHHQLYPWCPFCDHGHGEDEEVMEPEPDPSISQ